jgi:RNA polymerase sigma factor (sigma-70 family)
LDEGVVVTTTTEVLMAMHTFRGESLFSTWAERVARYNGIDEARRLISKCTPFQLFDPSANDWVFGNALKVKADDGYNALLAQVRQPLNAEERLLLEAKMEGRSSVEIARELGVKTETIRKRWERLREKVCHVLGPQRAQPS